MPSIDIPSLIAVLIEHHLLDGPAEAVLPELSLTCATATDLVAELVRRRWLTHFQAETLLNGRGRELLVGDRYVLLERLGQGGMGSVYKARHRTLKAVRAVKVIHPERLTGPNAVRRFFQEVEAVGKLFHPNIILPHDAECTNGVYWLAMEYVPGADLGRLLDRGGPLVAADACEYIRQGALALQHAHERGLVHRDIKPANLLVSSADGRVKLLDLGLARVRALEEEGVGPATALTQAGAMMGTPDYMAPEQAVDSHGVDTRADIYAMGCTLYHVLAGRPPFSGGSVMDKIIKHRTQDPPALETLRNDLPPGLSAIVRKAMAKSPESRYQTPAELASALAPFCANASPAKPRPAGASGEHPIFPAVNRTSVVTVASTAESAADIKPGPHRAPTPPAKPTVTAPPGAMPSPLSRTVRSLETHLEPTQLPLPTLAADLPIRRRRRSNLVPVAVMMVVGGLAAVGVKFLLNPTARHDSEFAAATPPPAAPPAPTATPIEPAAADTGHVVAAAAVSETTEPRPAADGKERTRPAAARGGGRLATPAGRGGRGEAAPATDRPAVVQPREQLYRLKGDVVHALAISPGGRWAAVVADANLDIYDLSKRRARPEGPGSLDQLAPGLSDPGRAPTAVAVTADGRHAYLTTLVPSDTERDGKPRGSSFNAVVHYETQQVPAVLFGPPAETIRPEFLCVGVSADGDVLAAGAFKSGVASWWNGAVKPPERRELKPLVGGGVPGLAFAADGKHALFCGRDGDLYLHTLGLIGGAPPLKLKGHPRGALCAAFSADGRFAISGGRDGKVCVWDFTGPPPADGFLRPAKEVAWHQGEVKAVAFAPTGDRFLSGGEDGYLCLGRVSQASYLLRERLDVAPARVLAVAFSADGAYATYGTQRSLGRYLLQAPAPAEPRAAGSGSAPAARSLTAR